MTSRMHSSQEPLHVDPNATDKGQTTIGGVPTERFECKPVARTHPVSTPSLSPPPQRLRPARALAYAPCAPLLSSEKVAGLCGFAPRRMSRVQVH